MHADTAGYRVGHKAIWRGITAMPIGRLCMAEAVRFELTRGVNPCRFSVPTMAFATNPLGLWSLDHAFTLARWGLRWEPSDLYTFWIAPAWLGITSGL
jgi:hypothetical protein